MENKLGVGEKLIWILEKYGTINYSTIDIEYKKMWFQKMPVVTVGEIKVARETLSETISALYDALWIIYNA